MTAALTGAGPQRIRPGRWLVAPALLLVALILTYPPVPAWIGSQWLGLRGFYGHGLLVVALAMALLWRALSGAPRRQGVSVPAAVLLLGATAAMGVAGLVAWAGDLLIGRVLALWATLYLGWWALLGRGAGGMLLAPFLLILLALPVWAPLQPPLQAAATVAVETALRGLGIPTFVDGNFITIPNGTFQVEGGCSGLGFVLVSLSLAGYLAVDAGASLIRSLTALAAALALAILANWLRILLIVLVGHHLGMGHPLVAGHVAFGWVVYGLLFLPFAFALAAYLPRRRAAAPADQGPGPLTEAPEPAAEAPQRALWSAVVILAAIAAPAYGRYLESQPAAPSDRPALSAPVVDGYRAEPNPPVDWRPRFPGADATLMVRYLPQTEEAGEVLWFAADYPRQGPDAEVVNRMNDLAGAGWRRTGQQPGAGAAAGTPLTREVSVDTDQRRRLVWSWYRIGDRHAGSAAAAKAWQIVERLRGRADARLTALATLCESPDCRRADARLRDFTERAGLQPQRRR